MEVIPLDHQNRSKFTASPSLLQHNPFRKPEDVTSENMIE